MEFSIEEIDILTNLLDQVQFSRKDMIKVETLYQKLVQYKQSKEQEPIKEE